MKLLLLGLPGAGKGTVGKTLSVLFSAPHVSIGDRVRDLAREDSPLGERLRQGFAASPGWAPLADDLAVQIAETEVAGLSGWILDGFPRTVLQAQLAPWIDGADAAIHLSVSEATARTRVLGRGREGDADDKFQKRMAAERERLPVLLHHLHSCLRLVTVDADQPVDTVLASILELLKGGGQ